MTTSMHRLAAGAAGVISLGLLVAACGSSSSSTSASGTSSGASSASSASSSASSSAASGQAEIKTASTSLGTVLTDAQGFTIYWFAKDTSTSSACSGACATYWPPVIGKPVAASGVTLTGKLGTIKRSDGSLQATYNGHPLYTYKGDTSAGQVSGNNVNGFGGLWYAVTASGSGASSGATTPAASPSSTGGGYGY